MDLHSAGTPHWIPAPNGAGFKDKQQLYNNKSMLCLNTSAMQNIRGCKIKQDWEYFPKAMKPPSPESHFKPSVSRINEKKSVKTKKNNPQTKLSCIMLVLCDVSHWKAPSFNVEEEQDYHEAPNPIFQIQP